MIKDFTSRKNIFFKLSATEYKMKNSYYILKSLLKNIALDNKNVQSEPEPIVRFREFGESGIKLQLLFWIYKPEIRGRTVDKVNTDIYKQFALNNIIIPYPTMKVLMPEK